MGRIKSGIAPTPKKKKTGHPLKPIDWKKVDKMLEAACTGVEVASYFGMHPSTFYDRVQAEKGMNFTYYQTEKRKRGDSFLREKQHELALAGDKVMLVWLGKNRLGQKDNPEALSDSKSAVEKYINSEKEKLHVRNTAPVPEAESEPTK